MQSYIKPLVSYVRYKLDPSSHVYRVPFPNADTILLILPFFLFALLLVTAFFVTYYSYQRILFYPDTTPAKISII
jgi:hypothetical protein